MLPPLEGGYIGARDDTLMRHGAMHRHEARVREIATTNIIEYNARKRVERAHNNKTQSPLQAQEFSVGDLVDTVLRGGKACQAVYDAYHEVGWIQG